MTSDYIYDFSKNNGFSCQGWLFPLGQYLPLLRSGDYPELYDGLVGNTASIWCDFFQGTLARTAFPWLNILSSHILLSVRVLKLWNDSHFVIWRAVITSWKGATAHHNLWGFSVPAVEGGVTRCQDTSSWGAGYLILFHVCKGESLSCSVVSNSLQPYGL